MMNLIKLLMYCATHDCNGEGQEEIGCKAPWDEESPSECKMCHQVLLWKAAVALEKQAEETEKWKSAWATANKLYDEMKDENARLKKELDRQMSICGR